MAIDLYSNGCERCIVVKDMLADKSIPYTMHDVSGASGLLTLADAYAARELDLPKHQAMPVIGTKELMYEGADCINAINDEELEGEY